MRNQPETQHVYNIPRLNWWFLISSAVFVLCFALMIWVDYSGGSIPLLGLKGDRKWKPYQREFYELEKKRLAADAQAAEIRAQEQGLDKLRADEKQLNEQLAARRDDLAQAQQEAARQKVRADRITREFTMEKATRDEVRSFLEAALARNRENPDSDEVREWRFKVETQNEKVAKLELEKQLHDAKHAEAQAAVEALVGAREDVERSIKRLLAGKTIITKRLDQLSSPLVQAVVNAPVAEFASGTYRVEQIVAEKHHVNVNFTTVPRVDRCITCHKGIDRKDLTPEEKSWREKHQLEVIEWSHLAQPLRSHPQLDLFVSETSPHPMSKFGCTSCHWGWDRETDFSRAGHTPDAVVKRPYRVNEKTKLWEPAADDATAEAATGKTALMTQRDAWKENYDWYHEHYNLQPMREQQYVQASCLKCHSQETHLRGAEKLDHGRRLIEQLGCWSCHKMKQIESYSVHVVGAGESLEEICRSYDVNPDDVRRLNGLSQNVSLNIGRELQIPIRTLRNPGPSLYKVATKTDKEWTRKWLADPVAFRPNTYMPKFWGLDNNKGTPERNTVEMNAITEFLFTVSQTPATPPPPVKGDAGKGQALVMELGCLGCHVVDENLLDLKAPKDLAQYMDDWEYRRARSQGPQLAGTGSKTTVNWLYAWLKDPHAYHPKTKMPSLRLSDQEAADVAEYLVGQRHAKTDAEKLPAPDANVLRAVTLEYLQVTLPRKQAEEKLNDLDSFIEMYFADPETMKYFTDPARLAREEARLKALQQEYEETFDDAVQAKADALATAIKRVKDQIVAAQKRAATLDATQKQNVFLGSKLIQRYGCYACHEIHGFETAKPIGAELTEWGSKTINKLDFGLLEMEHDRIAWLKQKLRAPRSYDNDRVGITRSPQELLKMPKFSLTEEQIDQIVTVVTGMTDEKLTADEPRKLTPAEHTIERGRWAVKELNCVGCHQIEGKGWAIRGTGIPPGMEPPMISGTPTQLRQGQRTQPDWLFHFLKAPQTGQVRPWLKARMPTFGLSDAEANLLVKYFAYEGRAQFPYVTPQYNSDPVHLAAGHQLFDQLKCALCHIVEGKALGKPLAEIPAEDLPRLAPNLSLAAKRLQRDWLINRWLPEPLAQVPGTRMPQFEYGATIAPHVLGGDGKKQREALVDYMLSLGAAADRPPVNAGPQHTSNPAVTEQPGEVKLK